MPLDAVSLSAACRFSFARPVAGWAALEQGTNQVAFGGALDPAAWDQAYAGVLTVAGGGAATIDLTNFTDLTGQTGVALAAVLGLIARAEPADPDNSDIAVRVGPGDANGFQWLAGAGAVALGAGESVVKMGAPAGGGGAVGGTHRTLKVANAGADAATVTIVIIGHT
ncbi:hypothetical protein GobsT_12210 [Gemmata obscuriglobus]|uniref:Uncharacterized protein n=1 Tax=Gemmata obscuriglobus TaxID=114 RepID=A0A2Z3HFX6_9BACT|nr:hypothetical protein [Gemmata obscuriglobus]AWM40310.1 hypothetical protein C1280_27105 [Gemmata obscuriglobus]QEG26481.1 hypothetical protein GobsT_12210 [Gemmata obscuriglobus]VTS01732.1 unnamed protein product [Gemmata obscuriglobus UQM 2246]